MSAHLVERATQHPQKCLFTGDIDGPFIDTGVKFDPGGSLYTHAYIHAPYWEQVARELLGMRPASEVEAMQEQVKALGEEIEGLREQLNAMDGLLELQAKVAA